MIVAEANDMAGAGVPLAAPLITNRVTRRIAAPSPSEMGNCITVHITPTARMVQRTETLAGRIFVITETAASRKKALPMGGLRATVTRPSFGLVCGRRPAQRGLAQLDG